MRKPAANVVRGVVRFWLADEAMANEPWVESRHLTVDVLVDTRLSTIPESRPPLDLVFRRYRVAIRGGLVTLGTPELAVTYREVGVPFRQLVDSETGLEIGYVNKKFVTFGCNVSGGRDGQSVEGLPLKHHLQWWHKDGEEMDDGTREPYGEGSMFDQVRYADRVLLAGGDQDKIIAAVDRMEAALNPKNGSLRGFRLPKMFVTSSTQLLLDAELVKARVLRILWGDEQLDRMLAPAGASKVRYEHDDKGTFIGVTLLDAAGEEIAYRELLPGCVWAVADGQELRPGRVIMNLEKPVQWCNLQEAKAAFPVFVDEISDLVRAEAVTEIGGQRAVDAMMLRSVPTDGWAWVRGFSERISVLTTERWFRVKEDDRPVKPLPGVLIGQAGAVVWDLNRLPHHWRNRKHATGPVVKKVTHVPEKPNMSGPTVVSEPPAAASQPAEPAAVAEPVSTPVSEPTSEPVSTPVSEIAVEQPVVEATPA